MNGADAIVKTLAENGVTVCFANPGTSEMHFVSALDREPRIRPVLCLFEGVATGAADGFARVSGQAAATLLHLGPGFANGAANLHNAKRARSPIVNIVGDHALDHLALDAPLTSDIMGAARPFSVWTQSIPDLASVARYAADALSAAHGSTAGPATLILPADMAWGTVDDGIAIPTAARADLPIPSNAVIDSIANAVRTAQKAVFLINGSALLPDGLKAAARLAAAGYRIISDTFPAIQTRGAGHFAPDRMMYHSEMALADLAGVDLLVLVETDPPVAFFAYPDKAGGLVPQGCQVMTLAARGEDGVAAMSALAVRLNAPSAGAEVERSIPPPPAGELSAITVGLSLTRHMPEGAIVSEDAVTSGFPAFYTTRAAAKHQWLYLTGGAIGQAIPAAIGAAIAAPNEKVIALSGDGAAMYTIQSLWTIAREQLDIVTIIFANNAYRVLNIEMLRTCAEAGGETTASLLSLDNPKIDWVALGKSLGISGMLCASAEDFDATLADAMMRKGPFLIQANIV
jgi:acetolactate synthase I/II/III large subunit